MSDSDILEQCQEMSPYEFEELVAKIWREYGYDCTVTSGSGDKGVDIVATKSAPVAEEIIIQAKRYADDNKIGSKQVREYATLRQQEETADRIILITTTTFTSQAEDLAASLDVDLIDGADLLEILTETQILNSHDINNKTSDSPPSDPKSTGSYSSSGQMTGTSETVSEESNHNSNIGKSSTQTDELLRSLKTVTQDRVNELLETQSLTNKADLWSETDKDELQRSLGWQQFIELKQELLTEGIIPADYWEGTRGNAQGTRAVPEGDYPEYELECQYMFPSSKIRTSPAIFDDLLVNYTPSSSVQLLRLGDSPAVVWDQNIYGTIESSPVIQAGKIFVPTFDDNSGDIFILDLWSGDVLDRVSTAEQPLSPIVNEQWLYVKTLSGKVFMYDFRNEERIWETDVGANDAVVGSNYDTKFYPDITIRTKDDVTGLLYVPAVDGTITTLDIETGNIQWEASVQNHCWSTAAVVGTNIVIVDSEGSTYNFDAETGDLVWQTATDVDWSDINEATPTGHSSKSDHPPAVACTDKYVCISINQYLVTYDTTTGDLLWKFELKSSSGQPAIAGDTVFIPDSRRLYAVSLENGKGKFTYDLDKLEFDATSGLNTAVEIGLKEGKIIATTWGNTVLFK